MLELYQQAHIDYTAIDPSNNMPYKSTCFSADRFAELIVNECINQCAYMPNSNDGWDNGVRWAAHQISEYFGVKE